MAQRCLQCNGQGRVKGQQQYPTCGGSGFRHLGESIQTLLQQASPGGGTYLDEGAQARQYAKADRIGEQVAAFGDAAFEPVIKALDDRNLYVREAASKALIRMRTRRAVPVLTTIVEDVHKPHDLRLNAMRALGVIGDRSASNLLFSVVQRGGSWEERRTAADALKSMGWAPEKKEERIRIAIAREQWDEIKRDPEAIEPLCTAAQRRQNGGYGSSSTQVYHDVLRELLQWTLEKSSDSALSSVMKLGVTMPTGTNERLVLNDDIREIVKRELQRRGKSFSA